MRRAITLVTALPEFAAHEVQAGVDAGRGAGAGDQVAVVDEQHVAVHARAVGIAPGQVVGVHPVRGAGAPVQQAGRAGDERAPSTRSG